MKTTRQKTPFVLKKVLIINFRLLISIFRAEFHLYSHRFRSQGNSFASLFTKDEISQQHSFWPLRTVTHSLCNYGEKDRLSDSRLTT